MSKETLEHMSSLMDGELSRETGLFLTRRLSSDEELTAAWERYHLIRDCIRHQGGLISVTDFSQRVKIAISEEADETRSGRLTGRWLKPLAGIAVAASVAAVAIFIAGPVQQGAGPEAAPASVAERFSSPNNLVASPVSQPASFSPQSANTNQRLNSYLLRHNQLAGSAGRQGFVSFVPILSAGDAAAKEGEEPETAVETEQEASQP